MRNIALADKGEPLSGAYYVDIDRITANFSTHTNEK
jgi:hypothetical protein